MIKIPWPGKMNPPGTPTVLPVLSALNCASMPRTRWIGIRGGKKRWKRPGGSEPGPVELQPGPHQWVDPAERFSADHRCLPLEPR